jgi:hypothetical protein
MAAIIGDLNWLVQGGFDGAQFMSNAAGRTLLTVRCSDAIGSVRRHCACARETPSESRPLRTVDRVRYNACKSTTILRL